MVFRIPPITATGEIATVSSGSTQGASGGNEAAAASNTSGNCNACKVASCGNRASTTATVRLSVRKAAPRIPSPISTLTLPRIILGITAGSRIR
jgi:hypothetical protein